MDKRIFLVLAVIGLILPYSQFVSFLLENGVDTRLIIEEITAYRLSVFAWVDVIISAIVVIIAVFEDKIKQWWIPVVASLLIGPSCGLPLYLYLRRE